MGQWSTGTNAICPGSIHYLPHPGLYCILFKEQTALLVPLINRFSSSCQPVAVFLHRFRKHFACSCFWRDVRATFLRCLGGYEGRLSPGRTVLSSFSPARRRPAAPPCAPTRIARGMSGLWTRHSILSGAICNLLNT